MNSDFSPELRKELLDDFYAECDELLSAVRESLGALEGALRTRGEAGPLVEALFRTIHSLKGIAAIAGVRSAEQLAHAMEDLLRGLSRAEVTLTRPRLGLLLDAAQRLEQIIGAHRSGKPLPDGTMLSELLRRESPPVAAVPTVTVAPAAPSGDRASDEVAALQARGLTPWRCRFAPAAALDQRGVNVTNVRERLGRLGEIVKAVPVVRPGAGIVFEFLVGIRPADTPTDLTPWRADGIEMEPVAGVYAESPRAAETPERGAVDEPVGAVAGESESATGEMQSLAPSHLVRVDLARLDELMRIAGDLVIQRSRLEEHIARQFGGNELLKQIDLGFARSLRELRRAIARVRLVPIAGIFTRMPFVVRDLEADSNKRARVALEGPQTEIDKYLVERLKEPLLHLVRNAFTHGLESPEERDAAGKPREATILLRAVSTGDSVVVQVRDDGRGVDPAAVVARAKALGMAVPERLDTNAVLQVLCEPGFSTREHADRAAGRGVGMAVVANTIRELGGMLTLESEVGVGSVFTLRLPLTVSIIDAIIVAVGSELCAVPQTAVDEIVQVPAAEARRIRDSEIVPYRGGLLPYLRLRNVFRMEHAEGELLTLLVLRSERGAAGLVVDRVKTRREVVVRSFTDPLVRVPGISGATELGDGRPILILDPGALTNGVVRPPDALEETLVA